MGRGIQFLRMTALLLIACCVLLIWSCADGDDDDDDNDDADDDADDDDSSSTAPVIDTLHPYPEAIFPGEVINMNFHFTDADANLQGGQIHITVGTQAIDSQPITYDPGDEGYITTYVQTGPDWETGILEISVYLVDAALETSNTITADFEMYGPNTPPFISNLRFDPDPACNEDGSIFTILFDFFDPDGNVGGGSLAVWLDSIFPQQFIISSDFTDTEGTIPLEATLIGDAPEGAVAQIGVQLADNQGALSERLDSELTFSGAGCAE